MTHKRTNRWLWRLTAIALLIIVLSQYWRSRDFLAQWMDAAMESHAYVADKVALDRILSEFEVVAIQDLPPVYVKASKMDVPPYQKMVATLKFYKLKKRDVYRKVAGNIRIKDLISKDEYYRRAGYFSDEPLYWGIDKRILYKLLELQQALHAKGYNQDGFHANTGHRTPAFNEALEGASQSRHIAGEAVDLAIEDINGDGRYTEADKNIVLELCEKEIIKNKGGIGRYPGTRAVHIDVRGYRARWDKY